MKIQATFFGQTRTVRATPHNMRDDEQPEEIMWIEQPGDMYALLSPEYKNKRVALVHRHDWLAAPGARK